MTGRASNREILTAIRRRRSVRRFRDEPLDRSLLEALIEAATWAPSAGNRQDWFFTIVTSPGCKRAMAEAVRARWAAIIEAHRDMGMIEEVERYVASFDRFADAPAVIAVSARRPDAAQKHLLGEEAAATAGSAASAAMAAQNLLLAAHALGLGACCMTGALAAPSQLAAILGLSRRHEIVCLVAVGRAAEQPVAPPRKPLSEVARWIE